MYLKSMILIKAASVSSNIFQTFLASSLYTAFIQNFSTYTTSLYSTHLHSWRKTCIDNILTNNSESVLASGTIENDKHHKPIFQIADIKSNVESNYKAQKKKIYYDFSHDNLEKLCTYLLQNNLETNASENFEIFNEFFINAIEHSCKLDIPRITKRTSITNPWISNGIINSAIEKIRLYHVDKVKIKHFADGDPVKYMAYKEHRKILCKIIKLAKKSFYGKKF